MSITGCRERTPTRRWLCYLCSGCWPETVSQGGGCCWETVEIEPTDHFGLERAAITRGWDAVEQARFVFEYWIEGGFSVCGEKCTLVQERPEKLVLLEEDRETAEATETECSVTDAMGPLTDWLMGTLPPGSLRAGL